MHRGANGALLLLNVSSNRADCTRCHFYTNVYKTTKFAGQSDDSEGDNHNNIHNAPVSEVMHAAQRALCSLLTNRLLLSSEFCGTESRLRCSWTSHRFYKNTFITCCKL